VGRIAGQKQAKAPHWFRHEAAMHRDLISQARYNTHREGDLLSSGRPIR
jgi:hypothetical protein